MKFQKIQLKLSMSTNLMKNLNNRKYTTSEMTRITRQSMTYFITVMTSMRIKQALLSIKSLF